MLKMFTTAAAAAAATTIRPMSGIPKVFNLGTSGDSGSGTYLGRILFMSPVCVKVLTGSIN